MVLYCLIVSFTEVCKRDKLYKIKSSVFKIYGFDCIATLGLSSTGVNPKILNITRKTKCGSL